MLSSLFEHFTDSARRAMALANQQGIRNRREFIHPEQILWGILMVPDCTAVRVLNQFGVDVGSVLTALEQICEAPEQEVRQPPLAKKVLEHAINAAREFKHEHIGTEHLLFGLLKLQDTAASAILHNAGVIYDSAAALTANFESGSK
jgi:ATP-dependent Clp protease ATP-binding subunit ClpC